MTQLSYQLKQHKQKHKQVLRNLPEANELVRKSILFPRDNIKINTSCEWEEKNSLELKINSMNGPKWTKIPSKYFGKLHHDLINTKRD